MASVLAQAVAKALREREQALLTVHALQNELRQKRRGISSLEESGQQVGLPNDHRAHLLAISVGHKLILTQRVKSDPQDAAWVYLSRQQPP